MAKTMKAYVGRQLFEPALPIQPAALSDGLHDFLPELHRDRLAATLGAMRTEKTAHTADAKQKRKS